MFSCVIIGAAAAASSSPTKRRYVPDTQDIDVVKRMKLNEVELTDRNTVLRGVKQSASRSISTILLDLFLVELFICSKPDQRADEETARDTGGVSCCCKPILVFFQVR
jgi:hypothetical protein